MVFQGAEQAEREGRPASQLPNLSHAHWFSVPYLSCLLLNRWKAFCNNNLFLLYSLSMPISPSSHCLLLFFFVLSLVCVIRHLLSSLVLQHLLILVVYTQISFSQTQYKIGLPFSCSHIDSFSRLHFIVNYATTFPTFQISNLKLP